MRQDSEQLDAVSISNVTKSFGAVTAVRDLSLTIPQGAIHGFIGPNGSGKTTTMRMIARIFYPDTGDIRVFGKDVSSSPIGSVGYLPEERGIYKKMTVRSLLQFHAELRGGTGAATHIDKWLERFDLAHCAARPVESLSKGMTQKVQFIAAVVPEPRLLILDEPFSGLDPLSAEVIRTAIIDLRRAGTTIILSTHDMSVAENMCDRILMIFRGEKVLDGTLADIQARYARDVVRLSVDNSVHVLDGLPGIEQIRDFGGSQELRVTGDCDTHELLRAIMSRTRVNSFAITKPSLQDIFVRIAGKNGETNVA